MVQPGAKSHIGGLTSLSDVGMWGESKLGSHCWEKTFLLLLLPFLWEWRVTSFFS